MIETITRVRTFEKYTGEDIKEPVVSKATIVVFDNGEFDDPESVYFENEKIRISDYNQGLANWSEEQREYVRHYYGMERPLGQLKEILVEVIQ